MIYWISAGILILALGIVAAVVKVNVDRYREIKGSHRDPENRRRGKDEKANWSFLPPTEKGDLI